MVIKKGSRHYLFDKRYTKNQSLLGIPNFSIRIYPDNLSITQIRKLLISGKIEDLEILGAYPCPWVRIACLFRAEKDQALTSLSPVFWDRYFTTEIDSTIAVIDRFYLIEKALVIGGDNIPLNF